MSFLLVVQRSVPGLFSGEGAGAERKTLSYWQEQVTKKPRETGKKTERIGKKVNIFSLEQQTTLALVLPHSDSNLRQESKHRNSALENSFCNCAFIIFHPPQPQALRGHKLQPTGCLLSYENIYPTMLTLALKPGNSATSLFSSQLEFVKCYESLGFILLSIYCVQVPLERGTLITTAP